MYCHLHGLPKRNLRSRRPRNFWMKVLNWREFLTMLQPVGRSLAVRKKSQQYQEPLLPDAIKGRELARDAGAAALGKDYAEAENEFLNPHPCD